MRREKFIALGFGSLGARHLNYTVFAAQLGLSTSMLRFDSRPNTKMRRNQNEQNDNYCVCFRTYLL